MRIISSLAPANLEQLRQSALLNEASNIARAEVPRPTCRAAHLIRQSELRDHVLHLRAPAHYSGRRARLPLCTDLICLFRGHEKGRKEIAKKSQILKAKFLHENGNKKSTLTNTKDVNRPAMIVFLRCHALYLKLKHRFQAGRRRDAEKLGKVVLHPVILLQHLECFINVKLLRTQEAGKESIIFTALSTQITRCEQRTKLLDFRIPLVILIQLLLGSLKPVFI